MFFKNYFRSSAQVIHEALSIGIRIKIWSDPEFARRRAELRPVRIVTVGVVVLVCV
jgi:hypothetical protein